MILLLALLISAFEPSFAICRDSYVTLCDCLTDLNNYKTQNWTKMEIGSKEKCNDCYSTTINRNSLDNLNKIKRLSIVNQVYSIESDAFENVRKTLLYLNFHRNNLTKIRRNMFSGFRKLGQLYLRDNNIEVLERNSFQDSNIQDLDLSNNKIRYLYSFTFEVDAKIKRIFIRKNELVQVNCFAFHEKLEALHLDHNKIQFILNYFPAASKLKKLTMSDNRLNQISGIWSLKHVKKLDFSFNVINHVESKQLQKLMMLEVLNLSYNKLQTFSLKALKKIKTKVTLLLSYNLLTNLEILRSKPMTLTLFGNPWNCACLEKMEMMMDHSNVSRTRCDLELFSSGNMPICLVQQECNSLPVENNSVFKRFLKAVEMNKNNLPCDLYYDCDV